jgi:phenylacetate-CoA ligase
VNSIETIAATSRPRIGDWQGYKELRRLQDAHLAQALDAAARSPFYRARGEDVPTNRAELQTTALTTKRDLLEAYPFGLLAVDRAQLATYHESSGSSGVPTSSYYTAGDWLDLAERFARKRVGIHPHDMFLVRTPYALMITGHLAHAAARMCGATVVPADNRSLAMPYSRVVRVMRDLGVTVTWSLPTDTLLWAAAAAAAGHQTDRDFPSLRALFVGGEPLSAARRERIAELWSASVVEEYGATETGSLAGECPHGRLHLWADRVLFEVHDPSTGRTTAAGRGQLVVTPLFREAMPLLRYNMEDEVEVTYGDCDCGWWLPTVRVLGRTAFECRVGRLPVTQTGLEELVFRLPEEFGVLFWRARAGSTHLRIDIEVGDRHCGPAVTALSDAVGRAYGIEVEVVPVPLGGLVPRSLLTDTAEVAKPRGLFREDEDWDRALRYYQRS